MEERKRDRYLVGCYFVKGDLRRKIPNNVTLVEVVDGVKRTINIEDPDVSFFFDKVGCPGENTPRMYVPLEHVDQHVCTYREMPEVVSGLTGYGADWIKKASIEGNRRTAIETLKRHNSAHGTDVNMEDYYIGWYLDEYADRIIENPVLHKAHSDIELDVYSTERFPSAELAECPIDLMTIYSDKANEMWTYALSEVDPPNPQIAELRRNKEAFEREVEDRFGLNHYSIMFYDDEVTMMRAYFKRLHWLRPDFIGFWNMCQFDFKYMKNRLEKLTGKSAHAFMCPPATGDPKTDPFPVVDIDTYDDDRSHDFSTMASYVKVVGWTNWVDQLITFANLRATMGKRDSYALDEIAQDILDEREGQTTKDPIPVSLREFSRWSYHDYVMN